MPILSFLLTTGGFNKILTVKKLQLLQLQKNFTPVPDANPPPADSALG